MVAWERALAGLEGMRRVPSLRRLGPPLARIGRCPCPCPRRLAAPLSTATETEVLDGEASAELHPVQDLALSKGKMKRLKVIAAQKGIDSTGVSRPELVQRILSANPRADSASKPESAGDRDEPQPETRPRVEYSEQLKQLSKAYHQLVTRLVAQGNDTAVSATLTRARAAGVEEWILQTALEQQPMPNLDLPGDLPVPLDSEASRVQARNQAARLEAAQEAEEHKQKQAAEEDAQRRAQQIEQIEQAIAHDERSTAEVRADCRERGLSTTATRDELLRRLMLHDISAGPELAGKLPDDLGSITLEHYTAAQLKTWCMDKGLPHNGSKLDLIERLEGFSTGRHTGHVDARDILSGSLKKYAFFSFRAGSMPSLRLIDVPMLMVALLLGQV